MNVTRGIRARRLLPLFASIAFSGVATGQPIDCQPLNPLSLRGLRALSANEAPRFTTVAIMPEVSGLPRRVVEFEVDGLRQFALVMEPAGAPPADGWPVVIVHHGYHPDPPQYGRVAGGHSDRPGDYYRSVPTAFAGAGFVTVTPDFRGHNDSAGREYTGRALASYWYSRDAIGAFLAVGSLPRVDRRRIFAWGHSMGAHVALRSVLALGDGYRAVSIWSPAIGDPWNAVLQQAAASTAAGGLIELRGSGLARLRDELAALPFRFDTADGDPARHLGELQAPLILHHARQETEVTPFAWSVELAAELVRLNRPVHFYAYPGAEHMLRDAAFGEAIARDVEFFTGSGKVPTAPGLSASPCMRHDGHP